MRTRYECPLSSCDWRHDVDPIEGATWAVKVGDALGVGLTGLIASHVHMRAAETERALEKHLRTHGLVEFVREIVELRAEVDRLEDERSDLRGELFASPGD